MFALIGKGENLRPRFESSESETTLPQATARRVRSEATNNPSPTTISSITSKFELPLVGFPSGQREQTVNLPSSTSKVRILPPPPSLHVLPSLLHLRYFIFCPTGKDEKLRLRFDSSVARERCRRQRPEGRGALAPSYPSPTTIPSCITQLTPLAILYILPHGKG